MQNISMYTDGSARGNPNGPGGYGTILTYIAPDGTEHTREYSRGYVKTTNNRMELTAAVSALECLKEPCIVDLYSDSKYLIDGLEKGWAASWKKNGWKKADKKPALNTDLWDRLLLLTAQHEVKYHWVKGHDVNDYNNRCDSIAVSERDKQV